jgi:hypothetical protein
MKISNKNRSKIQKEEIKVNKDIPRIAVWVTGLSIFVLVVLLV